MKALSLKTLITRGLPQLGQQSIIVFPPLLIPPFQVERFSADIFFCIFDTTGKPDRAKL